MQRPAERGVLVRGGSALGATGALRVTYGTPEENARFLEALGEVLALVPAPIAGDRPAAPRRRALAAACHRWTMRRRLLQPSHGHELEHSPSLSRYRRPRAPLVVCAPYAWRFI